MSVIFYDIVYKNSGFRKSLFSLDHEVELTVSGNEMNLTREALENFVESLKTTQPGLNQSTTPTPNLKLRKTRIKITKIS